jgi:hypothetical protein
MSAPRFSKKQNLAPFQRVELVLKLESLIREKAREGNYILGSNCSARYNLAWAERAEVSASGSAIRHYLIAQTQCALSVRKCCC